MKCYCIDTAPVPPCLLEANRIVSGPVYQDLQDIQHGGGHL